jgi:hypothetical protein
MLPQISFALCWITMSKVRTSTSSKEIRYAEDKKRKEISKTKDIR